MGHGRIPPQDPPRAGGLKIARTALSIGLRAESQAMLGHLSACLQCSLHSVGSTCTMYLRQIWTLVVGAYMYKHRHVAGKYCFFWISWVPLMFCIFRLL